MASSHNDAISSTDAKRPRHLPVSPLSQIHGYDRGTPIDRHYIASFLSEHTKEIRGSALEVKDDRYLHEFGQGVHNASVVDCDPINQRADYVADLTEVGSLPSESFDCIVCTQTMQFLTDPRAALTNLWQALRRDGTLLLTVPALGRMSVSIPHVDYWRISPRGLRLLLSDWIGNVEFNEYGNLRTCLAMLIGEAAEELRDSELQCHDPAFPVLGCAAARRG